MPADTWQLGCACKTAEKPLDSNSNNKSSGKPHFPAYYLDKIPFIIFCLKTTVQFLWIFCPCCIYLDCKQREPWIPPVFVMVPMEPALKLPKALSLSKGKPQLPSGWAGHRASCFWEPQWWCMGWNGVELALAAGIFRYWTFRVSLAERLLCAGNAQENVFSRKFYTIIMICCNYIVYLYL